MTQDMQKHTRFFYFTPSDVQVARVDRQCIVRFCEAMSAFVDELKVVSVKITLSAHEGGADDLYRVYGVRKCFEFVLLPTRARQERRTVLLAVAATLRYAAYAFRALRGRGDRIGDVIYLKNYVYLIPFILINKFRRHQASIIFEIHAPPKNAFQRALAARAHGIVVNSHALKRDLEAKQVFPRTRMLGMHQGVNLDYIESIRVTKGEARRRLGVPPDAFVAVYTGKVYDGYEEIEYYLRAAELLGPDYTFLIVGGRADRVERLRQRTRHLEHVIFRSFVPPSEIYFYHFCADVLLLYYPPGIPLNSYRSPGKLFEYMASGAPIIAADYPVLEEVVRHGESAWFVKKDDPEALARAIALLRENPARAAALAMNALRLAPEYSWGRRAERIHRFITSG